MTPGGGFPVVGTTDGSGVAVGSFAPNQLIEVGFFDIRTNYSWTESFSVGGSGSTTRVRSVVHDQFNTDSDGDGLSDFGENVVGTRGDLERVKKPSLIMFYILTMEDALCQGLGTGESCFNIILIIEI